MATTAALYADWNADKCTSHTKAKRPRMMSFEERLSQESKQFMGIQRAFPVATVAR